MAICHMFVRGKSFLVPGMTGTRSWELAASNLECFRIGVSHIPAFFIYYPSRRQQTAVLSALIIALRILKARDLELQTP